jgi:hypothetical protein
VGKLLELCVDYAEKYLGTLGIDTGTRPENSDVLGED